ncbi:hypothetical protein M413DRAFT_32938 [Hebeloma cylindrosporum]|uniref:Uncharacterized protein n=1 Tax=Hebeloma cylindrosporum TaxID=76867 RepID=A0A0C3BS32_HEBCY|nr:hypothetical protein M413DRAFT_32938 [Hebeloma cylindrosporum h7]
MNDHPRLGLACEGSGGEVNALACKGGGDGTDGWVRADYGSPPHVPPGLPYHGSPLVFPTYSQHTSPSQDPSTSTLGGLHPSLEGRGQVAASLGA